MAAQKLCWFCPDCRQQMSLSSIVSIANFSPVRSNWQVNFYGIFRIQNVTHAPKKLVAPFGQHLEHA